MKEADRMRLLKLSDAIYNVEKAYSELSPAARSEFEEYAAKHMEDLATSRAKKGIKPTFRSFTVDPINTITSYINETYSDEMKEKYPQLSGISDIYEYQGKKFRYNFDTRSVEYGYFQTAEQLQESVKKGQMESGEEYTDKQINLIYGKPGWNIIDTIGLSINNWYDVETRNDYLDDYIYQMEEEISYILQTEFKRTPNTGQKKKHISR